MENELDEAEFKTNSLEVIPESINFGNLSPGQSATVTVLVRGGQGNIIFPNDLFKITPTDFVIEGSDVQITLLSGSSGELIWDEIVLQTSTHEIKVPITARWEVHEFERSLDTSVEPPVIQRVEKNARLKEKRNFKGRACSRCGKTFTYDIDSTSWEECTCNWYQIIRNLSVRVYKDLRFGIKEFPSYVQEMWRIIVGKEKW